MSEKLLDAWENYKKAKLQLSLKEKTLRALVKYQGQKKDKPYEKYLSAPENDEMTDKKVSFFKSNSLSNIFFPPL